MNIDVLKIAREEFRFFLKSKKLVIFLIFYLAIFFLIFYAFLKIQTEINSQMENFGIDNNKRRFLEPMVRTFLQNSTKSKVMDFLLDISISNFVIFMITIFGTPLLIMIAKYDAFSQEIYDKTIRFLLFRVSRANIFFAKFISAVLEFAIITFFSFVVAIIWSKLALDDFDFWENFKTGIYFWLVSQFFLSFFIAFFLGISSLTTKPFYSLFISCFVLLFFAMTTIWFDYLSPFNSFYSSGFFCGMSMELIKSIIFYSAATSIFLIIFFILFKKRNL